MPSAYFFFADLTKVDASDTLLVVDKSQPRDWQKTARSILLHIVNNWWTVELLGVALSFACLGVVIVLCINIEGKPLSHWRLPISPNSIIAILTTVSKTAILMVLSEVISQWKWLYYHQAQPQRLGNIDTFNEASQGPFGALKFLLKMRTSATIASTSSAIVIACLAFGPVTQQVLSFQQQLNVDPEKIPRLPTAQVYSSELAGEWFQSSRVDGPSCTTSDLCTLLVLSTFMANNAVAFLLDRTLQAAILDGFFGSSYKG